MQNLLQLHTPRGIEKGIPYSLQDGQALKLQKIGCSFNEIMDMIGQITNSTTFEERQNLQKILYTAIIKLRAIVLPETAETTEATPNTAEGPKIRAASFERILSLYAINKGMPRGKYQYIAHALNSNFEYDEKKLPWTEDSIKKAIQKLRKISNTRLY
ncbi:MAG: hypothetical protein ABFD50_06300 [Smithella sp.]